MKVGQVLRVASPPTPSLSLRQMHSAQVGTIGRCGGVRLHTDHEAAELQISAQFETEKTQGIYAKRQKN